MAGGGTPDMSDVLIVHGRDGNEWCIYLKDLLLSSCNVRTQNILSYQVDNDARFHSKDLQVFWSTKCILILLSQDLVNSFSKPTIIKNLQKALRPPQKVVVLFCGVPNCGDFEELFEDWSQWKHLSCEDDADAYVTAVRETIMEGSSAMDVYVTHGIELFSKETGGYFVSSKIRQFNFMSRKDSGCESITDTEAEAEKHAIYSKKIETCPESPIAEKEPNNLSAVLPGRIHCGVTTKIYIIVKCTLDSNANIEVEFNSRNLSPQRIQATLENEYTISLYAPDLPSGLVYLEVYSDDAMVCSGQINYYTDMEEIRSLLDSATNPVEFMCQAFKIVPYNIDTLDKLLTESLKNNIPASGLHLFGVHQIEEEDLSTNQRDDELPTLLHFAAKYGLKNLTALLLTCPGALQAYSVCNKHGDFPNGIAEKYGFKDLRQFMDDYVETVGMLKSHFKEEMMQAEDEDGSIYESMADVSTELLMKCSLNPGCNEDFYESMVGLTPQYASEDLYVQMEKTEPVYSPQPDIFSMTSKESMIRKFLKESNSDVPEDEDCGRQRFVKDDPIPPEITKRRPLPAPRPESSNQPEENQLYISKVFAEKAGKKRTENIYIHTGNLPDSPVLSRQDRALSSTYDPFAGMKTPGQRQLITLQEQVKSGMITVDEAVLRFKDWHLNERRRSESFKYQQENLQRLRDSITRRQHERRKKGKSADLTITKPMKSGQDLPPAAQYDVYEYCPKQSIEPPKKGIQRGTWNTESSSSTASSTSNRSSTRSTLSFSSGVEGDSEDNEIPETRPGPRAALAQPSRAPRIPPRTANRPNKNYSPPPVPPRGR